MTLYKVLGENGEPVNGGNGAWHLPKGKRPGKWMPPIEGDLVPCQNGYHLCRQQDLVYWLGPTIWRSEYKGEMVEDDNKIVVRQARTIGPTAWNERIARLFAADCAERVLPIFEKKYPNDDRTRNAIKTARAFANGDATKQELDTARDAAWSAAGAAARDAARDTAWAAARAAAWATAWDAAWAAACSAGWAAEREWQTKRLMEYLNGEQS